MPLKLHRSRRLFWRQSANAQAALHQPSEWRTTTMALVGERPRRRPDRPPAPTGPKISSRGKAGMQGVTPVPRRPDRMRAAARPGHRAAGGRRATHHDTGRPYRIRPRRRVDVCRHGAAAGRDRPAGQRLPPRMTREYPATRGPGSVLSHFVVSAVGPPGPPGAAAAASSGGGSTLSPGRCSTTATSPPPMRPTTCARMSSGSCARTWTIPGCPGLHRRGANVGTHARPAVHRPARGRSAA